MENLPVNVVDIAVGVILLISGFLAYARGFVHEVLSVGGWIGAIFATMHGAEYLKPYAHDLIPHETAADAAAYVTIFVVTLVVLSILTRTVAKQVQDSTLNVLDRSLGFIFGAARGAFLVCIAYIALTWAWPAAEQPVWLRDARSMPLIEQGADVLRSFIPEDAAEQGAQAARNAQQRAEQAMEAERLVRGLLKPAPEGPQVQDHSGYAEQDRARLNRLFQTQ